jgi:selenide,water dikinase
MADLAHVLRHLPHGTDDNLLSGGDPADDAAVYRLAPDQALVQTVDFFTPIVDDPYTFGAIAAANSLSDVYAVGARPAFALNIAAFPIKTLAASILIEILRGGAEKAAEAGVTIIGGHTVDDEEPKYGLAVTGFVHPDRFLSPRNARPGDALVLTKPIGTGVVSTALKEEAASASDLAQSVRWMTTLNAAASRAALQAGAHAATDVTGFGLLGHLMEMCRVSGVSAEIEAGAVPLLPGALDYARKGYIPGGTITNLSALRSHIVDAEGVEDAFLNLLADPQTSGGLLVALSMDDLGGFVQAASTDMLSAVIGRVGSGAAGAISLRF